MSLQSGEPTFSHRDRRILLQIARRAIEASLGGPSFSIEQCPTPALGQPAGVFVTLRDRLGLRGCIGTLEADSPLFQTVARTAPEAALSDPRFEPLSLSDLPGVTLELSILGSFELVQSLDEIQLGRHGLRARDDLRSGLLLPQVPSEFGWDRDQFLDHLCLKAGLAPDRWRKPGLVLERFTAEVFSEIEENEGLIDFRQVLPPAGE